MAERGYVADEICGVAPFSWGAGGVCMKGCGTGKPN